MVCTGVLLLLQIASADSAISKTLANSIPMSNCGELRECLLAGHGLLYAGRAMCR